MRSFSQTKTCEKCTETFGCGSADTACWCSEQTLSKETLEQLKRIYHDCLCPKCLLELEKNES